MRTASWPIIIRKLRIMAPEVSSQSDFQVLGLEPGAKPSEVKQAYRTLVKRWHPDRHYSKPYETRALPKKSSGKSTRRTGVFPRAGKKLQHLAGRRLASRRPGPALMPRNGPEQKLARHSSRPDQGENRYPTFFQGKNRRACPVIGGNCFHFDTISFIFSG